MWIHMDNIAQEIEKICKMAKVYIYNLYNFVIQESLYRAL